MLLHESQLAILLKPNRVKPFTCRITFESRQVRDAFSSVQQAASAGEAKPSDPAKSPLFGASTAPAGIDHQVPRPNFGQILAKCDFDGKEPIFATPDCSLDHRDRDSLSRGQSPGSMRLDSGE